MFYLATESEIKNICFNQSKSFYKDAIGAAHKNSHLLVVNLDMTSIDKKILASYAKLDLI